VCVFIKEYKKKKKKIDRLQQPGNRFYDTRSQSMIMLMAFVGLSHSSHSQLGIARRCMLKRDNNFFFFLTKRKRT
jgi:hypothetical protein